MPLGSSAWRLLLCSLRTAEDLCPPVLPGAAACGEVLLDQGPGWALGFRSALLVGWLLGSDEKGASDSKRATLNPRALN